MRMQLIKGLGRLRDILRLIGEQVEKFETVILRSFSHTKSSIKVPYRKTTLLQFLTNTALDIGY